MSEQAILVSTVPGSGADPLCRHVRAAGFTAVEHVLGSTPAIDFVSLSAAVIEPGERLDAASAQTRRWRIELGDAHLPILWVLPAASSEQTTLALEAGADACLARPLDSSAFAAQLRAAVRVRTSFARQTAKAAEGRLLGDRLQKAYRQIDLEHDMARRIQQSLHSRTFPDVGAARFTVTREGENFAGNVIFDVLRLDADHVGFFLGEVMGRATGGGLLAIFARQAVVPKEITADGYNLFSPDAVLAGVNRELVGLGFDDPPFVAMLYGRLNARTGELAYARAGMPPPVFMPAGGEPMVAATPGPFLGVFSAAYPVREMRLNPGDRFLLTTAGSREESDSNAGSVSESLRQAVLAHHALAGQSFVDAVAGSLNPSDQSIDATLMLAEFTNV